MNDLLALLRDVDAAVVADVLDEFAMPGQVLSNRIHLLTTGRVVGIAACVEFVIKNSLTGAARTYDDFTSVDALASPGHVIVMAGGPGAAGAVTGEFMAREFARRGAAGLVTDCAVRDVATIAKVGFPVFAASASPLNGARRLAIASTQQPVALPGESAPEVPVRPGDLIVADTDGVVVIPAQIAHAVALAAQAYAAAEREIVALMAEGRPRVEAMKAVSRVDRIRHYLPAKD